MSQDGGAKTGEWRWIRQLRRLSSCIISESSGPMEEKQILEVDSRAHSAQMLVVCVYLCILVSQRIQNN